MKDLQQQLARLERAVASSLWWLESDEPGSVERAREELRRASDIGGVSDRELERAFAEASPETDKMLHADDVAHAAIRQTEAALEADFAPDEVGASFATATMAELLEQQGDRESASRIRATLESKGSEGVPPGRTQVIATLERWLHNLRSRGGVRA